MSTVVSKFKFAAIQLAVGADKQDNIKRADKMIREAVSNGANVVSLPEVSIMLCEETNNLAILSKIVSSQTFTLHNIIVLELSLWK
jgi:predicted amidohydrolase